MAMPVESEQRQGLPHATEWTVDDLDRIPDDGLRYELLDGSVLVSPAPVLLHQLVAANLFDVIRSACPAHLVALFAPVDWRPDRFTSLEPDLLVVGTDELGGANVARPPTLVVEILSPSTRRRDRLLKRSRYEEGGIGSYWIVDPEQPSIEALLLVDGVYQREVFAVGDESVTIEYPFPVTVRPADLVRH